MKVYSASEALWPALLRTYSYLFRRFKWETFLKLATLATVSEGFIVAIRFSIPDAIPFEVDWAAWRSFLLSREFLPVTLLFGAAFFLFGVYCFYLVIRLRFAFVHSLIHQTRAVGQASKLYIREAERFFTASVAVGLVFLVALALTVVAFVVAGYTVFSARTPEGKLDPGNFFLLFLPCMGLVTILLLLASAAQVILNDFILPHMAIEGLTFRRAWAEVRARIAANRETFISFFILRMGVPIFAGIVLVLLAWGADWLVFGLLGMSSAGFSAMLDGLPGVRQYLLIALQVLFVGLGVAAGWIVAVSFGGPLGVFVRSYALVFYGGHYRPLGYLLDPPTPPNALTEAEQENFALQKSMSEA
jgi:hypothetical protein